MSPLHRHSEKTSTRENQQTGPAAAARSHAAGRFVEWTLGDGAAIVRIHANVVDTLTAQAARFQQPGNFAGVLLGSADPGTPCIFRVESYEQVTASPAHSTWVSGLVALRQSWREKRERGSRLRALGHFLYAQDVAGIAESQAGLLREYEAPALGMLLHGKAPGGFAASMVFLRSTDEQDIQISKVFLPASGSPLLAGPEPLADDTSIQQYAESSPPAVPVEGTGLARHVPGWAIIAAVAALLGIGAAVAWLRNAPETQPAPAAGSSKLAGGSLGLRVERVPGGFAVQWDKNARALQGASAGMLSITERGSRKDLYLDAAQLSSARVIYGSTSEDIYFSLQILGRDQSTASDSVRWIQSGGTESAGIYTAPPPPPMVGAKPAPLPKNRPDSGMPSSQQSVPVEAQPQSATRTFKAPAQQVQHAATPELPSPPAEKAAPAEFAGTLSGEAMRSLQPVTKPAAPPVAPPAPVVEHAAPIQAAAEKVQQATAPATLPTPSTVTASSPPVPVQKPLPVWPKELAGWLQRPAEIVIKVQVDPSGKVVSATPVGRPPVPGSVVAIAVNTSLLWRFTPAKVNGRGVPGTFEIHFLLASGQRR